MEQSVIHRTITVAPGRFAPGHLGELTQQIPFEMVDAALAQTGRVQCRLRDLPARVVVYLLVAGCLFAEQGYVQVWQRLCAGLGAPRAGDIREFHGGRHALARIEKSRHFIEAVVGHSSHTDVRVRLAATRRGVFDARQ